MSIYYICYILYIQDIGDKTYIQDCTYNYCC